MTVAFGPVLTRGVRPDFTTPMTLSLAERLTLVRARMRDAGVDALLVRSTDRYLNEYVPLEDSLRTWLTGFTGSMGEALVTHDAAFLAVDGRYWLQADQQLDPACFSVLRVSVGQSTDVALAEKLKTLGALTVGFERAKITPSELEALVRGAGPAITWKGLHPSPVEEARGARPASATPVALRALDEARVGLTVQAKHDAMVDKLAALGVDALLVQRLDEIAYLTNLRADELPYQATFRATLLVTREAWVVGVDPARLPVSPALAAARPSLRFVPEAELWSSLGACGRVGFDPHHNTELGRHLIGAAGATAVAVESPIGAMKARKHPAELRSMTEAFARADEVVSEAQRWLCAEVLAKRKVTEADFAERVRALFLASGAVGLSFKVISAAGKNGAIIHYSDPSPTRVIKKGELMLLDTGAYYEEGYATDLTRTFLVGGARDKGTAAQRRHYTLVLKSAIAGMTAVVPEGARGYQLDAITRAPLWAAGLDYNHGTGHGVGVNVHEFPPRIGPTAAARLEEGYVFSIEPGVYKPDFGGVRIENLCTLIKSKSRPGYLEVRPLTYSPLDLRLVDRALLTAAEKAWLDAYGQAHGSPAQRRLRKQAAAGVARTGRRVQRVRAAARVAR